MFHQYQFGYIIVARRLSFALVFATACLLKFYEQEISYMNIIVPLVILTWLSVLLPAIYKLDRIKRTRARRLVEAEAPAAAEQWEQGESGRE